jgi:hypothetical protein
MFSYVELKTLIPLLGTDVLSNWPVFLSKLSFGTDLSLRIELRCWLVA